MSIAEATVTGVCVCLCVCFIVMNMAEGMTLSLLIKEVEGWNETLMRGMMSTQKGILIVIPEFHVCLFMWVYMCVCERDGCKTNYPERTQTWVKKSLLNIESSNKNVLKVYLHQEIDLNSV